MLNGVLPGCVVFRGSVALATSSSGQTVYIEPASVIELNNKIASLKSSEDDAENSVLDYLSDKAWLLLFFCTEV